MDQELKIAIGAMTLDMVDMIAHYRLNVDISNFEPIRLMHLRVWLSEANYLEN
jgi:hypothetical protein